MNLKNKKILLTGGKGTLGSQLIPLLKEAGAKVTAPPKKELNVSDIISVVEEVELGEYDLIIHAAAWTDVPKCEIRKHQQNVIDVNVVGCSNISYAASELNDIKVVYISTDYVYSCASGGYKNTDPPNPKTFYGFSKLAGESYFDLKNDLIIRTSFAKRGTWGPGRKQYSVAFTDSYTTKDWVDVIAPKIIDAISEEKTGITNIGTTKKSIYELAVEDYPDVVPVSINDVDLTYEYPSDASLESSI
jgi:dTDP-4-dehydrorhamnose reductase